MARRFRVDIATRTVLARFAAAPPTRTLGAPGPLRLALDAGPRAATHQLAAPGTRRAPGYITTPRTDAVPAGRVELAAAGGAVLHCGQCPYQASRRASRRASRDGPRSDGNLELVAVVGRQPVDVRTLGYDAARVQLVVGHVVVA